MKIGILGAGQLALMMIEAGKKLDLEFRTFDPASDACAAKEAEFVHAKFEDTQALLRFSTGLGAVTLEWENVPASSAQAVQAEVPNFFPHPEAVSVLQDRLTQKQLLTSLGIANAIYHSVETLAELKRAIQYVGTPAVLKLRRQGYDGKGQVKVQTDSDAESAWKKLGEKPCIFEKWIQFDREVSLVFARDQKGKYKFYPLVQNEHQDGILKLTRAPAPKLSPILQITAEATAKKIGEKFNTAGVFAIEFFQMKEFLSVNEIAPRVHNSGHWTIEGTACSQFENHLRAGLGLAMGPTQATHVCVMLNLIGTLPLERAQRELREIPGATLHLYGKLPRPGRKLGHLTIIADTEAAIEIRLAKARLLLN